MEHDDVEVVAVNDPFIETHYAVRDLRSRFFNKKEQLVNILRLGIHAQI